MSAEADALTGLRKSARATRTEHGLLPPTISIGGGASVYYADELIEITAARAAGMDDDAIRGIVRRQIERRRLAITAAAA